MKVVLLFALVNGVFSYFNFPDFRPDTTYLSGCTSKGSTGNSYGRFNPSNFVRIDSLTKRNIRPLKTVVCYKGSLSLILALTEKNVEPRSDNPAIVVELDKRTGLRSITSIFASPIPCDVLESPPYMSPAGVNCVHIEAVDNYKDGKGRVAITVLGDEPVVATCLDIPQSSIRRLQYIGYATEGAGSGYIYMDCSPDKGINYGVWGRPPGISVDVSQDQYVRT